MPDSPPPARADTRLALPAVAAWTTSAFVPGLDVWQGLLLAFALLGASAVAARRRRWAVAVGLLLSSAAGLLAVLRVAAVAGGPVPALADARAEVDAQLVSVSAPVSRQGRFGPFVLLRARVELVTGRGMSSTVRSPVLVIADESWADVRPGERVLGEGRLAPADGPDLAGVLVARGPPVGLSTPNALQRGVESLRRGLRQAVSGLGPVERVLVPALVVGDDAGMPESAVEDFRTCGLTHLLAVSGANLTLVLGFVLLVARWCRVRARWLSVVGALGIAGFVLLAHAEPSVLRAAAMGLAALAGLGPGGVRRGIRTLSLAVVVLLLVDPWLARSLGFLLSVLATAGIVVLAPSWRAAMARWLPQWLAEALAIPMAAQAVCTPVVVGISGELSLVAVFANLVAAPAVGPATVLGLLACLAAPVSAVVAGAIGTLAGIPAWWIASIAERGASLPGASVPWDANAVSLSLLTAVCLALVAVTPILLSHRWWCLGLTAVLVMALVRTPAALGWPPAGWTMVACDVGQGDALVLSAGAERAIVVDAGPDPRLVDRCLDRLGVSVVPLVVLTHLHADHVSGLPGVLAGRHVGEVEIGPLDSPPEQFAAVQHWTSAADIPLTRASYGEQRAIGSLAWTVIAPVPARDSGSYLAVSDTDAPENNASLVLMVTVGDRRLLLSGDVEPPGQRALLRSGVDLRADVLKVPHHGSRYQDPEFLDSVDARLTVISAGADNDYGHPAPETLAFVEADGAQVERTDLVGDIAVVLDGEGMAVATRR